MCMQQNTKGSMICAFMPELYELQNLFQYTPIHLCTTTHSKIQWHSLLFRQPLLHSIMFTTFHTALPWKLMNSFYILSQRLLTETDGWTNVSQIFSRGGTTEIIIQTPRNPYICKQLYGHYKLVGNATNYCKENPNKMHL